MPALRPFEVVGLVVIVVAGVGLRFVASSPLWLDEALTVNVARLPLADIPDALGRDGLPPLFYLLLHQWMTWFGEGDAAARALSGVFSVAALPLAFLAGRRLGGVRMGALALAVLAANPYAIRYATETRMYSLVVLLVLAGFLAVDAALARPRPLRLAAVAVVTALLLYTHYWSLWLGAATALVLATAAWRRRGTSEVGAPVRVVLAMVVGGLAFLPWVPTFLDQAAHTATPWASASRPSEVVATALVEFGGGEVMEARFLGATLLALLFVVGLLGRPDPPWRVVLDLRTAPPAQGAAAVAIATLVIGSLASLVSDSAFVGRYASVVFPLFLLVVAAGLAHLPDRRIAAATLGVTALLGLGLAANESRTDRTQAGVIADAILAGDPGGAAVGERPLVVYCPDQLGPAVDRLLPPGAFDQVIFPELDSVTVESPERIDWYDYVDRQESVPPGEVAEALLERAGDGNAIWVVYNPTYRTPGDRCLELVDALAATREGRAVVAADGSTFFEHASLNLYLPPAP